MTHDWCPPIPIARGYVRQCRRPGCGAVRELFDGRLPQWRVCRGGEMGPVLPTMPACGGSMQHVGRVGGARITLDLNPQQAHALQQLASTGYFGPDAPCVLLRLMDERLRALVTDGWVTLPAAPKRQSKRKGR